LRYRDARFGPAALRRAALIAAIDAIGEFLVVEAGGGIFRFELGEIFGTFAEMQAASATAPTRIRRMPTMPSTRLVPLGGFGQGRQRRGGPLLLRGARVRRS